MLQILLLYSVSTSTCPNISTVPNLNLTEYIRAPWYIQMQQETPYLPKSSNYCVTARYSKSNHTVPFYNGIVLDVYNNARLNNVSGMQLNNNNNTLCARVNGISSKLLVAPCFLPNLFAGDYWIIHAGPNSSNYEYAIVSGGQPTNKYTNGCTTSTTTVNNSGLWILTRNITISLSLISKLKKYLVDSGFTVSLLNYVQQLNCSY